MIEDSKLDAMARKLSEARVEISELKGKLDALRVALVAITRVAENAVGFEVDPVNLHSIEVNHYTIEEVER